MAGIGKNGSAAVIAEYILSGIDFPPVVRGIARWSDERVDGAGSQRSVQVVAALERFAREERALPMAKDLGARVA